MKLSRVGVDLGKNVYQLHGATDCAAVRKALREEQQERRQRCRGDLRSHELTEHALCHGEER